VYDTHDTSDIHVIAKRPLLGLINETDVYGNILFVAATHHGVFALNYSSDSLSIIAHYDMSAMGDTAAYDMWRTHDTLYIADNHQVRMLKYNSGTGFTRIGSFGGPGTNCVARRGNYIAVGNQVLPGNVTVYNIQNLSTPVASWSSPLIFAVQDLQFADLRNDIIYVCGGPNDLLFTKSSLFALQLSGNTLTPVDTFTVSGGIPGYAQMNIMNMDSRNDTLFVVTTAAYNSSTYPLSYLPIIDATGLPTDTMKKIGYVIPGLWNFDVVLMRGTPYIAMSSEWCGVLINNISHLQPSDTLSFLETGGWCLGSKIRHDTLWAFHEGYGLVAYKLDSLYYHYGFNTHSKILHIYRQFVSDFDFLNDTLIVLTSGMGDIYSIKPWLNGGYPHRVDSLGYGQSSQMKVVHTNVGLRVVDGWNNMLSPPEAILLLDPFSTTHPRPILDSIHTQCSLYSMCVSNDTLYCGMLLNNKYYLAAYKVANDSFVFIDSIVAQGEINSITVENGIIAMGTNMNLKWYKLISGTFTEQGAFFDWHINPMGLKLKNKLLYVADKFYGMKIFSLAQSPQATLVAECRGTGGYKNLYGSGRIDVGPKGLIYLSDFHAGIIIIEAFDSTLINTVPKPQTQYVVENLSVYPNPAKNQMTIEFSTSEEINAYFEIYDISGKKMDNTFKKHYPTGINSKTIDLKDIPDGVYLLVMKHDKGVEKRIFEVMK